MSWKYYLAGAKRSNLIRSDGSGWWATDDHGDWVGMTDAVQRYIGDQNQVTPVSAAEAQLQYEIWFPKGAGLAAPA